ncbi:hypothetical protein B0H11DRAFT_2197399 [Mycena galericulata]|nr:hypothetical protein B0H11DRAFT_2197399 [Mycena galericulata]
MTTMQTQTSKTTSLAIWLCMGQLRAGDVPAPAIGPGSISLRNRERNRAAQCAFRERKAHRIKTLSSRARNKLEDRVSMLVAQNAQITNENMSLRILIDLLTRENTRLKQSLFTRSHRDTALPGQISGMRTSCTEPSPFLFTLESSSPTELEPALIETLGTANRLSTHFLVSATKPVHPPESGSADPDFPTSSLFPFSTQNSLDDDFSELPLCNPLHCT